MKKIKGTKQPSTAQMLTMAENLMEKFGSPACVEIHAWRFMSSPELEFRIYVESICNDNQKSWAGCQNCYFALMEVKNG